MFIIDSLFFFKQTIGKSIKKCKRNFTVLNDNHIPIAVKDQESDGTTYLFFSDEKVFGFYANTENFTINVKEIRDDTEINNSKDVSSNNYWEKRLNVRIKDVSLVYGTNEHPYGISFILENDLKIDLHYISESDYEFDALVIR
jgi:hypothetical protein